MIGAMILAICGFVLIAMAVHTRMMNQMITIKGKVCDLTDGHMEFYKDDRFVNCEFLAGRIKIIGDVTFKDCIFFDTRIFFEKGTATFINCETQSFQEWEGDYKGRGL